MFHDPNELSELYGMSVIEVGDPSADHCVVIFHGFGADAFDLKPLGNVFGAKIPARWIFPNGLMEVPLGPGFVGRAWFPIDEAAHQRAAMLGQSVDYSHNYPPGMDQARASADVLVKGLRKDHKKLVIGGFSQGAMLSTDIALSNPGLVDGLMALSGTLLDEENWKKKAASLKGLPFFQSHGKKDLILPYDGAVGLEKLLVSAGLKGELLSFEGGHEIPHTVLVSIGIFLQKIFADQL